MEIISKILKILISITILFFIICICNNVWAKYIYEKKFQIGCITIDREKPTINIVKIERLEEKDFINLNFRIKVIENNIKENNLNLDNVFIKVNGSIYSSKKASIKEVIREANYIIYDVLIEEMPKTCDISLIIKDSIIMDISGQGNDKVEFVYFMENS